MANLTFPSNPTNGQKVFGDGKVFTYNSTKQKWVSTRLNIAGRSTVIPTNTPPTVEFNLDSISFDTEGQVKDIVYNYSDPDGSVVFFDSISNSGIANTSVANVEHFAANNTVRITVGSEAFTGSITVGVSDGRSTATATANVAGSFGLDWSSITEQQKILASDPEANDLFGNAVAIDGDTVVVGAYAEDTGGTDTGAAYIFTRSGSTWTQQARIQASNKGPGDTFGRFAVAIDGDTVVVGARSEDTGATNAGAAYIFTRSGSTWTEQQIIQASDKQASDFFGNSVAINGDTVIVGATGEDTGASGAGAAYIFTRSGSTWTQQQKIQASDPGASDTFGHSVAIDGDTVIVGSRFQDTGATDAGAAYVFTRSGSTWTQQQKIQASDLGANDFFGGWVAISGDTAVVGSGYSGESDAGAAYIFTRSGSTWTEQQKIQASDVEAGDEFGTSVAIDGDTIIVGSYSEDGGGSEIGAAYVFTRSGSTWTQQSKIQASDMENDDRFGLSVAISSDTVVIGAPFEDTGASAAGAAYIFTAS